MTQPPIYACAARTGSEFDVEADLREIGAWAIAPRRVVPFIPPNQSKPVPSERPLWPGYVFAALDAWRLFEARNIRHLHRTRLQLSAKEASQLMQVIEALDAENERLRREIDAGRRAVDLVKGERVEILDGPLAGRLGEFERIIRRSADRGFDLRIAVDGLPVPVTISASKASRA